MVFVLGVSAVNVEPVAAASLIRTRLDSSAVAAVPHTELGVWVSPPGYSMDAFARALEPVLRAWANRTGTEACGEIARTPNGSRIGAVIGTSYSHLACVNYTGRVPTGMVPTGITIHTHGTSANYQLNAADVALLGPSADARLGQIVPSDRRGLYHFSSTDFATGPGYLATPDGVIFEAGNLSSVRQDTDAPAIIWATVNSGAAGRAVAGVALAGGRHAMLLASGEFASITHLAATDTSPVTRGGGVTGSISVGGRLAAVLVDVPATLRGRPERGDVTGTIDAPFNE